MEEDHIADALKFAQAQRDELARLQAENTRLEAENKQLNDDLDATIRQRDRWGLAAHDENTRLREENKSQSQLVEKWLIYQLEREWGIYRWNMFEPERRRTLLDEARSQALGSKGT